MSTDATWLPVRGPDRVTIGRLKHFEDGYHVIDDRWRIESVHERIAVAERHCFVRTQAQHRAAAECVGEVLDLYVESGMLDVAVARIGDGAIGEREMQKLAEIIDRNRVIAVRVGELLAVIRGAA